MSFLAQSLLSMDGMYKNKAFYNAASSGNFAYLTSQHGKRLDPRTYQCSIEVAALNGHITIVKLHQPLGMSMHPNVINCAAQNGHTDIVEWLWESKCRSKKALFWAIGKGHIGVVKLLISKDCEYWDLKEAIEIAKMSIEMAKKANKRIKIQASILDFLKTIETNDK